MNLKRERERKKPTNEKSAKCSRTQYAAWNINFSRFIHSLIYRKCITAQCEIKKTKTKRKSLTTEMKEEEEKTQQLNQHCAPHEGFLNKIVSKWLKEKRERAHTA